MDPDSVLRNPSTTGEVGILGQNIRRLGKLGNCEHLNSSVYIYKGNGQVQSSQA